MSNNADTKTLIGEAATLRGLIDGSLTDIKDSDALEIGYYTLYQNTSIERVEFPSVIKVGEYGFGYCTNLTSVELQSVSRIYHRAFYGCSNLQIADLGNVTYSPASAFENCGKLSSLIMRGSPSSSQLNDMYPPPYIAWGNGVVYVPENMVSTYTNHANWWDITVLPISAYPVSDHGAITDTWDEIIAAENDGTYINKYHIGDKKLISFDGANRFFTIIAMDADELADGTGNAKITWAIHNGVLSHRMHSSTTTAGGWAESEMRDYLNTTIFGTLPSDLQGHIKSVKKTYYVHESSSTLSCNDKLWIPSYREVTGTDTKEDSGPIYTSVKRWAMPTSASQTSYGYMYTRTPSNNTDYYESSKNALVVTSATNTGYVRVCFCT